MTLVTPRQDCLERTTQTPKLRHKARPTSAYHWGVKGKHQTMTAAARTRPETRTAAAARALANLKTAEAHRPKAAARRPAPAAALALTAEPTATFDLTGAVRSMPANYLHCRDYGHHWNDFDSWWNAKERRYEDTLCCESCGSKRTRHIGPNGERLGEGGRDYAPGYELKGVGHVLSSLDRNQFRLATMRAKKRTPR